MANQVAQAVKIESSSIKPVIDGTMDEVWQDAPEYTISSYIPAGTSLKPPDGPMDISGKWRALWDSTNLYIYLEVTDDALVLAPLNSFELYLSTSYSRNFGFWADAGYDLNDAQILYALGNQPVVPIAGIYSVYSQENFPGTVTAVKETSTGYVAEVSITWTALNQDPEMGVTWDPDRGMFLGGPSQYQERNFIGFEIELQDDDDGGTRDTKVAWYGGPPDRHEDDAWADPKSGVRWNWRRNQPVAYLHNSMDCTIWEVDFSGLSVQGIFTKAIPLSSMPLIPMAGSMSSNPQNRMATTSTILPRTSSVIPESTITQITSCCP